MDGQRRRCQHGGQPEIAGFQQRLGAEDADPVRLLHQTGNMQVDMQMLVGDQLVDDIRAQPGVVGQQIAQPTPAHLAHVFLDEVKLFQAWRRAVFPKIVAQVCDVLGDDRIGFGRGAYGKVQPNTGGVALRCWAAPDPCIVPDVLRGGLGGLLLEPSFGFAFDPANEVLGNAEEIRCVHGPAGTAICPDVDLLDRWWLIIELVGVPVVVPLVDGGQFRTPGFGLDHAAHFAAGVMGDHIAYPAAHNA